MDKINAKWGYLFVLSLIWGTSFILIKKSLLGLSPVQLGALRTIITGVFLLLIGGKTLKNVELRQWKWIALSGFFGSFFPAFCFAFAQTQIDSTVASILNSLVPLCTIILGASLFNIQSTRRQVLGVIVGFLGTVALILAGADLNPSQNYLFAGFVIVAALMYAANVNIIKRYLQDVKPLTIAAGNYAVIVIPAVVALLSTDFLAEADFSDPELRVSLGYLTILALFGTATAKVLYNKLVQVSTPVFASSVTYVIPIVALMWGVVDGESFSAMQGLASLVILAGVYLSHKRNK
ncbi:DMT family transporter [Mangrovimonas aestuarii]|uniref:DMT family transporter n=1 Tax=Mangrovimonas aestuarii TaxID=3018443 RepID=UPI002378EC33|nr:EamA family transporter [Mangrovimonas aestuarii]